MTTTEIDHINDTLEKLDREINLLQQKRSHLHSRLNDLTSATRNVPPEVLTEIFRLSACKLNLREPQLYSIEVQMLLKLGSICSRWRRVAWSAPHLWTTSLLVQDDMVPPFIIELALSNSKAGCISVTVNLNDQQRENALYLFQHHRPRVRALQIHVPDDEASYDGWDRAAPYFTHPTEWPRLRDLRVYLPTDSSSDASLKLQVPGADSFHSCRRGQDLLTWYPPMHQLTTLHLHHFPIDQSIYLLLSCPGLVEFHCLDPSSNYLRLFEPRTLLAQSHRPKTFPNLKIFKWRANDGNWNLFLFSSFRFPNLERLLWGDCRIVHGRQPELDRALIDEFMPSLSGIIALDWEAWAQSLFSFQVTFAKTNLSSLQRLYISVDGVNFVNWLRRLTIDQQRDQCYLPGLRTVHVESSHVGLGDPTIFSAMHNFLRSRRKKPFVEVSGIATRNNLAERERWRAHTLLEQFYLETEEAPLRLDQHQMNALKELVDDGLIFELILPTEEFKRTTTLE